MRTVTALLACLSCLLCTSTIYAQKADFILDVPLSGDFTAPYRTGLQSGARGVNGPFDLDGDGRTEVLVTDYTGGGRVHVVENTGIDAWELVYSTPWMDSTAHSNNARFAAGADLDNDGRGEILFIAGHGYSATNPNIENLPLGVYIFEHTGTDNDYGDAPTTVLEVTSAVAGPSPSLLVEQFTVADVDGDGTQELLLPVNSSNNFDIFYVYSAVGNIGSGFEVFNIEAELNPRSNSAVFGGGSPYALLPANLDGEGLPELSLHSWNAFNFLNADVLGADSYSFPQEGAANTHLAATAPDDHVSLFGGVVVDINGDGDDEVFYPNFQTGAVSLLNYEPGEDVMQITTDQFTLGLLPNLTGLGITAGDIDGDGRPELVASGPAFSETRLQQGLPPTFVRVAKYLGGDVEDPASYSVIDLHYAEPFDVDSTQFDLIRRDSAGVTTEFLRGTDAAQRAGRPRGRGPVFISKLAYLGDVDGDGDVEVAAAFQGVDDSTYVIQETFNPQDGSYTQQVVAVRAASERPFLRVLSFNAEAVAVEDEPLLPQGYVLGANYPNPFNPSTTFSFTLPVANEVSVRIYDVTGRLVRTLVDNRPFASGTYELTWDGTNDAGAPVASGRYLYALEYDHVRQSRMMVLVK